MPEVHRTLTLLRHAKSDWPDGVPDFQRPLAARGRADAPVASGYLLEHWPEHELALCSPATRARQTWDLVQAELPGKPFVRYDERIYDASVNDLLGVVRELSPAAHSALLIGHNPGLSELASLLSGVRHELKTSGIAVLRWRGPWAGAGIGVAHVLDSAKPRA
jgi:phosphohistidine phosphatase